MPLTRLEVEQTHNDRFVAELELGGISATRKVFRDSSFVSLMQQVITGYAELTDPAPVIQDDPKTNRGEPKQRQRSVESARSA